MWQLKTVVSLHCCLICAFLLCIIAVNFANVRMASITKLETTRGGHGEFHPKWDGLKFFKVLALVSMHPQKITPFCYFALV